MKRLIGMILFFGALTIAQLAPAQNQSPVPAVMIQNMQSYYSLIPISATGGTSAQVTLTIPAPPPGQYNYVCTLGFNYSQTNTSGTVQTNAVTTSTNFNSWAIKFSVAAAVNTDYDLKREWGTPASGGCVKSTLPATTTTFVSPSGAAQGNFTWDAMYFQAP